MSLGKSLASEQPFGFLFSLAVLGRKTQGPTQARQLLPYQVLFSVIFSFALGQGLTKLPRQAPVLLSIHVTTTPGFEHMGSVPTAYRLRLGRWTKARTGC